MPDSEAAWADVLTSRYEHSSQSRRRGSLFYRMAIDASLMPNGISWENLVETG
jgi:hypothetical protein